MYHTSACVWYWHQTRTQSPLIIYCRKGIWKGNLTRAKVLGKEGETKSDWVRVCTGIYCGGLCQILGQCRITKKAGKQWKSGECKTARSLSCPLLQKNRFSMGWQLERLAVIFSNFNWRLTRLTFKSFWHLTIIIDENSVQEFKKILQINITARSPKVWPLLIYSCYILSYRFNPIRSQLETVLDFWLVDLCKKNVLLS